MYTVRYGERYIYYPKIESEQITEGVARIGVNESGTFEFEIPPGHSLYDEIQDMDVRNEVRLFDGEELIFCGRVVDRRDDIGGRRRFVCEGELAYLKDADARPHTAGLDGVPSETDGYFGWIVGRYNADVEAVQQFRLGYNQGRLVDPKNRIECEEAGDPDYGSLIRKNILEAKGGYIRARHERGVRYLDWIADFDRSGQRIEFGVNLLDFARTRTAKDLVTGLRAEGDGVTLASLPDAKLGDGFYKRGDTVFSGSLVAKYGVVSRHRTYGGISDAQALLDAAIADIKAQEVIEGLDIKAIDLHLIDPSVDKLRLGQYVRVTSKPHGVDLWMAVVQVELDIMDPGNTRYVLGRAESTLTNKTTLKVRALAAQADSLYVKAEAVGKEAKEAAERAQRAGEEAAGKNRVFGIRPTPPYDVDDVWMQGSTGDIFICARARQAGEAFQDNDWLLASKYTDDVAAEAAKQESAKAKDQADAASAAAKSASDAAAAAKTAADDATAQVTVVSEQARIAKSSADEAKEQAEAAAVAAGEVASQVGVIKGEISQIEDDAIHLREDLEDQIETVTVDMVANYARKTDLTETTAELRSEIALSAAEIQTTVDENYAKKTDLTEVRTDLQTQVTQNADNITSVATAATKAQTDATGARETANAAKAAADTASATAQTAATAASTAQTAADKAKKDAVEAQRLADEAQAAADEALQDANNLSIRADASDVQIAAAKANAAAAQTAANAAQTNANAAKTAATTAQSTADTAKASAISAQAQADAASSQAKAAQDGVNTLAGSVTVLQSKLEQTSESIVASFSKAQAQIDSLSQEVSDNWEKLVTYIRFSIDGMELGKVGSDLVAKLDNTELAFLQEGLKVAYINNKVMHITRAEITDELTINNWRWSQRANGNISFKWRQV